MTKVPKNTRKFKGFAVLDEGGKLIWGTIRTSQEEAEKLFRQWNPGTEMQSRSGRVVEVKISIDDEI